MPREDAPSLVSAESRGYAYDPAQNLAKRTNNASGSTVSATVNALNQLTAGLGFSSYTYDRRGNLTFADAGSWAHAFTYDHENQCVSAGGYYGPAKSEYVYDGKGRLRVRKDWSWTGSGWSPSSEVRYLYDGLRVIQERHAGNTPTVGYTRGLDLSGTPAGAGGIGGLLGSSTYSGGAWGGHAYYHADGNGNITYLLNQNRSHGASYKYDPYGRLIASTGPLSSANLMRFSSKPWHDHSETYYYGYRFYMPEAQRWPNRDPLGEPGFAVLRGGMANSWEELFFSGIPAERSQGPNLHAFVRNNPLDKIDLLGLSVGGPLPGWTSPGKPYNPGCNPFGPPAPPLGVLCRAGCAAAAAAGAALTCPTTGPGVAGCAAFWAVVGSLCADACPD